MADLSPYSDAYWTNLADLLGLPGTPDFLDLLKKVQSARFDGDGAAAARAAKNLAYLVKSLAGIVNTDYIDPEAPIDEVVARVFHKIDLCVQHHEDRGNVEDWRDLFEHEPDDRFDPEAGGLDISLIKEQERAAQEAQEARQQAFWASYLENLGPGAAALPKGDLMAFMNEAVHNPNGLGLVALADRLARSAAGEGAEDAAIDALRARILDQTLAAAESWRKGEPTAAPAAAPDPAPAPAAPEAAAVPRADAMPDEADILKMIEFLKNGNKIGALGIAQTAAEEMRRDGRSDEPANAIARRLLVEAATRMKAERESGKVENARHGTMDRIAEESLIRDGFDAVAKALSQRDAAGAKRLAADLAARLKAAGGRFKDLGAKDILARAGKFPKAQPAAAVPETDLAARFGEILAALDAKDGPRARDLATALAADLQAGGGKFAHMDAAAILKHLLAKKHQRDNARAGEGPANAPADAAAVATDSAEDAAQAPATALSLKLVLLVDWAKFCAVYQCDPDETDALVSLATTVVKKGVDAPAAIKEAKELLARARKKKSSPKVKNARHLCAAIEDVLQRRAENQKLTKPLKASDIPDDEELAA